MWEVAEYAIDRVVAEEADWACFDATHIVLPRRVRITVATAPSAAHWILREAHVLESLRHLGVPRVYDCGFVPGEAGSESLPWVAIELVIGEPVGPSPTVTEVAALLRDVGGILAHAHGRGVIHRDVSLHAIVAPGSAFRLVDWRRARAGTPAEAAEDIYALGLAAYAVMPSKSPRRLAALIADMLADADSRPTAATVAEHAARIIDEPVDDDIEEVALVVDLSREPALSQRWPAEQAWPVTEPGVPRDLIDSSGSPG